MSDFVFIDDAGEPKRVRPVTGEPDGDYWVYYWLEGPHRWVTQRMVDADEVERLKAKALPPDQAKLYEAGVPFLEDDADEGGRETIEWSLMEEGEQGSVFNDGSWKGELPKGTTVFVIEPLEAARCWKLHGAFVPDYEEGEAQVYQSRSHAKVAALKFFDAWLDAILGELAPSAAIREAGRRLLAFGNDE